MNLNARKKTSLTMVGILTGIVAFSLWTGISGCAEKETPEAFAKRVVETTIPGWDADALYSISNERFKEAAPIGDVREMFGFYSVLGKMKGFDPPEGELMHEKLPDGTEAEIGVYNVEAEFDNDTATIRIVAIRTDTGWELYGFKISSNYVMSMMEAKKREVEETHRELAESGANQ